MSHVFISYARSTAKEAQAVAAALRGLGHDVWLDDEIPAHRAYADVIEERLRAAKAVVVIWSAEAVKSQWVQSEADKAREDGKLVQLNLDGAKLPMPFDRIQCADMTGGAGTSTRPAGARSPPAWPTSSAAAAVGGRARRRGAACLCRASPPSPSCRSPTSRVTPSRTTSRTGWSRRSLGRFALQVHLRYRERLDPDLQRQVGHPTGRRAAAWASAMYSRAVCASQAGACASR